MFTSLVLSAADPKGRVDQSSTTALEVVLDMSGISAFHWPEDHDSSYWNRCHRGRRTISLERCRLQTIGTHLLIQSLKEIFQLTVDYRFYQIL